MKRRLFALGLAVLLTLLARTVPAQHETSDEISDETISGVSRILTLDLNKIDRYHYTVLVNGVPTTQLEGYSINQNGSYPRSPFQEVRSVIIDNLPPGRHSVTLEAKQDPNRKRAENREEFLFEYEPLSFDVTIDPFYITRHAIDVSEALNPRLIAHRTTQYTGKKWKTYTEMLDGSRVEVRIKQYRKGTNINSIVNRLNMKAAWALAEKHIYYIDIEVKLEEQTLLAEAKVPCAGRVTYQYYEPRKNQWLEDTFMDNMIDGRIRIQPYIRTVVLTPEYEMRLSGYDQTVAYTIVKRENVSEVAHQ
ncbi:MAG: hypothetical protein FJY97_20680 [candidate division Zixibacteria bacterium]|nr:hypothetical protein [candidate division Zixibacteria bacterium]